MPDSKEKRKLWNARYYQKHNAWKHQRSWEISPQQLPQKTIPSHEERLSYIRYKELKCQEKQTKKAIIHYRENKPKIRLTEKTRRVKQRIEILSFLCNGTPRCANPYCQHSEPYTDVRALVIDHIYGNGCVERRQVNGEIARYKLIRQHPERYQVLCANCNAIKAKENKETNHNKKYTELAIYPLQPISLMVIVPIKR